MESNPISSQSKTIIHATQPKYVQHRKDSRNLLTAFVQKNMHRPTYTQLCDEVLNRYRQIYSIEAVLSVFEGTSIILNTKTSAIENFNCSGEELWELLFNTIYEKKGSSWLYAIEAVILIFASKFGISIPSIFLEVFEHLKDEYFNFDNISQEKLDLLLRIEENIQKTESLLLRDPLTHVYNATVFRSFIEKELPHHPIGGFLWIGLDHFFSISTGQPDTIKYEYLKQLAQIIRSICPEPIQLFKFEPCTFCCYFPSHDKKNIIEFAQTIRNTVSESTLFLTPTSVSISSVLLSECEQQLAAMEQMVQGIIDVGLDRLSIAQSLGTNQVCFDTKINRSSIKMPKMVVLESDRLNANLIQNYFENCGYQVFVESDGERGLKLIEKMVPDIIISEQHLSKIEGIKLKEKLNQNIQKIYQIPFILISHKKTEPLVDQAMALNINHFFKKPYMMNEIGGVVKNYLKQAFNNAP